MATTAKHDETKGQTSANRSTVGAEAIKLQQQPDQKIEAVEIQREADREYLEEIQKCIEREPARSWTEPFYVVVLATKPGYLINVVRRRFFARKTLPTATPDQTVWKYYPKSGNLEFLWTLPDLDTINKISFNRNRLSREDQWLGEFVTDYLNKRLESRFIQSP